MCWQFPESDINSQKFHIAQPRSKLLHFLGLCSAMVGGLNQTNIGDFQWKGNISRYSCAVDPLFSEIYFHRFCNLKPFLGINDQIRPPLCSSPAFRMIQSRCSNPAVSSTGRARLPPYLTSNGSPCLCPCLITCCCLCKSQWWPLIHINLFFPSFAPFHSLFQRLK